MQTCKGTLFKGKMDQPKSIHHPAGDASHTVHSYSTKCIQGIYP
jgi:hypothetical protein